MREDGGSAGDDEAVSQDACKLSLVVQSSGRMDQLQCMKYCAGISTGVC